MCLPASGLGIGQQQQNDLCNGNGISIGGFTQQISVEI
jgi:hypothetical protein